MVQHMEYSNRLIFYNNSHIEICRQYLIDSLNKSLVMHLLPLSFYDLLNLKIQYHHPFRVHDKFFSLNLLLVISI